MDIANSQKITDILKTASSSNSVINITIRPPSSHEHKRDREEDEEEREEGGEGDGEEEEEENKRKKRKVAHRTQTSSSSSSSSSIPEKVLRLLNSGIEMFTVNFISNAQRTNTSYQIETDYIIEQGRDIFNSEYQDNVIINNHDGVPTRILTFRVDDIYTIDSCFLLNICNLQNIQDIEINQCPDNASSKFKIKITLCKCDHGYNKYVDSTLTRQRFVQAMAKAEHKNANSATKIIHSKIDHIFAFNKEIPWRSMVNPESGTYILEIPVYMPVFMFQLKQMFADPVLSDFKIRKSPTNITMIIELNIPDVKEFKDGFTF